MSAITKNSKKKRQTKQPTKSKPRQVANLVSGIIEDSMSAKVTNGKLVIHNYETNDNEIVEYFERIRPELRQDRCTRALRMGVMALKSTEVTDRIDYVEKKFNSLDYKFNTALEKTIQDLEVQYDDVYGDKGKFQEIMNNQFGEDGKLFKEVFNPNREGSPLHDLKLELREEIISLREALGIQEKEVEIKNKTPLKGADFEDDCYEILSDTARVSGDLVEDVTKQAGKIKGCKKGDQVLTISDCNKKVTFEIKDVASISSNKIQETLTQAIENREAAYGVLVVKNVDSLPKSIGWFHEFGNNMLVCALELSDEEALHDEILLIAYKWARTRVLSQNLQGSQVDAEAIEARIDSIKQKIDQLRSIKSQCTNIEGSSKKIRETAETVANEITGELDTMNRSLRVEESKNIEVS